jgi:hypothetical protein
MLQNHKLISPGCFAKVTIIAIAAGKDMGFGFELPD